MIIALLVAGSYLLGSIPFGILVARWLAGVDVREHGSGNIGATNVFRVAGRPAGIACLGLDVLKGLAPPLAASALGLAAGWQVAAGLAAIIGHGASPFLGFRGGKGVATSLGVLIGVSWKVAAGAFLLWGVVLAASGYVSVGSMAAAVALAPLSWLFYPGDWFRLGLGLGAGAYALAKHRANVARLRAGTESSIRRKPPPAG